MKYFDRSKMDFLPVKSRLSKIDIRKASVRGNDSAEPLSEILRKRIETIAGEIREARKLGKPVILAFGAHAVKNGLGSLMASLAEEGWITHLATNGAGVIHDWEFSYLGFSSEDVRVNVQEGRFGTWEETGLYINLALMDGAFRGMGYGEAVGSLISSGGIDIPHEKELLEILEAQSGDIPLWKRAAAADYLELIWSENLDAGRLEIAHPYSEYSIQARSLRNGTPFTSHPMFGHDIIYTHRANRGAAVGRCAERDFLSFVQSVSGLEGGVYLSLGSAVMSPMIFEKALSMARNLSCRIGNNIRNCRIHIVDLQEETWDWSLGEPPMDNPAYYLRFMKTFNRMGCPVDYTSMDNRDFILHLYKRLNQL